MAIERHEELLGFLPAVKLIKSLYDPKGEGILHGEIAAVIFLLVRQRKAILLSYNAAKKGVHKSCLTLISRKLYAFVYRGKIRHGAHLKNLADAKAKHVFGIWINVRRASARDGGNIIIVRKLMLHRCIKQSRKLGALFSCKAISRVGGESEIYIGFADLVFHKEVKCKFSYIHRLLEKLSMSRKRWRADTRRDAT